MDIPKRDGYGARIHELHGIPVEGFASNYVFHVQGHTLLLNVYVDDLTLSGAAHLHTSFWQQFQAKIKVEEPQMLKSDAPAHILGRLHCLEGPGTLSLKMDGYARQFVDLYVEITGVDTKTFRK